MTDDQWAQIRHFKKQELKCKCCGIEDMDFNFVMLLDAIRETVGFPININSGFRCKKRNEEIGGSEDSQHLVGLAVDVKCYLDNEVYKIAKSAFMLSLSVLTNQKLGSPYEGRFLHLDNRKSPIHKSY